MIINETALKVAKTMADNVYPLPYADVEQFASILECKTAEKGEVIIKEGQVTDGLLYVHQGLVRQFYYKNGHDVSEHFTAEGKLLHCIESLFLQHPTQLMAEALEPLIYYKIPYFKLKKLCDQSVNMARWYIRYLELDAVLSQHKADSLRFESAKERYERFQREYPEAAKRAPIQHIASYLIMTRESLSRVRAGKL